MKDPLSSKEEVLRLVLDYLDEQIDCLEECHTDFSDGTVDAEVAEEVAEVRGWIEQLRATDETSASPAGNK